MPGNGQKLNRSKKRSRSKKQPPEMEVTTTPDSGHGVHGHAGHGQASPSQAGHGQAGHGQAGHGQAGHSHVHDDESIRRIVNRLSRIEGHVRGLKRMVQEQDNCPDVLIQVAAVRGALDKVARLILDEHLTQCVLRAAEQGNIEAEIEELQAALNRFLP